MKILPAAVTPTPRHTSITCCPFTPLSVSCPQLQTSTPHKMPISTDTNLQKALCLACQLGKSSFTVLQDSPQEPPTWLLTLSVIYMEIVNSR